MKPRRTKPDYKQDFLTQLACLHVKTEPEFKFHPSRRWRADWRLLAPITGSRVPQPTKILVEFEGGLFNGKGGHSSVTGILRDCEKYNEAALMGWTVIRITPKHVVNGDALKWVERALKGPFYQS